MSKLVDTYQTMRPVAFATGWNYFKRQHLQDSRPVTWLGLWCYLKDNGHRVPRTTLRRWLEIYQATWTTRVLSSLETEEVGPRFILFAMIDGLKRVIKEFLRIP